MSSQAISSFADRSDFILSAVGTPTPSPKSSPSYISPTGEAQSPRREDSSVEEDDVLTTPSASGADEPFASASSGHSPFAERLEEDMYKRVVS